MENSNQEIIDKLNHLISIAADGKQGYENAAKDVEDEGMKLSFQLFSEERGEYVKQLQQEVTMLGGKAEDDEGGPVGRLHRTWMDLKSVFTSGDREAIIKACTTGEEAAIKEYTEALATSYITGPLHQLISKQRQGIQNALATIKEHATVD